MKLPYLGSLSHSLGRKLCRIVHNNYSTVKLKIVYTTSTNIGNFFSNSKTESPLLYALPLYISSRVIAVMLSMWVKQPAISLCAWKTIQVSHTEIRI